jgi:hypothetical protein
LTSSSSSSSSSSSNAASEGLIFSRSYYHEYYSKLGVVDPITLQQQQQLLQQKTLQHLAEDHDKYPALHESERDKEENHFIMSWALPVLLRYLPLDQIMLALGHATIQSTWRYLKSIRQIDLNLIRNAITQKKK